MGAPSTSIGGHGGSPGSGALEEKEAAHRGASPLPTSSSSSSSFFSSDSPSSASSRPYPAGPTPPTDPPSPDAEFSRPLQHLKLRTAADDGGAQSLSPASGPPSASPLSSLAGSTAFGSPTGAGLQLSGDRTDLQRPLFPAFDPTWAPRPASTSLDGGFSYSPAGQLHHLRSPVVGDAVSASAFHAPQSYGSDTAALQQKQKEVERLMGSLLHVYSVTVIPALTGSASGAFSPPGLSPYLDILRTEGCAFCLGQRDLIDEASPSSSRHYCVLQCALLQCRHVAHTQCLLSCLHSTPSPTAATSRRPALDVLHTTTTCRVLHSPLTRPLLSSSTEHSGGRRFAVDLSLAHACANTQQSRFSWPDIAFAQVDPSDLHHFLYLAFSTEDGAGRVDSPLSPTPSTSSAPPSPSTAPYGAPSLNPSSVWEVARFTALRGKLLFSCVDVVTQEAYEHCVQYDLSQASFATANGRGSSLRLVHCEVSGAHRNVLTVGVQRSRDGRAFVVASIRYDLCSTPHRPTSSYMAEMALPLSTSTLKPTNGPSAMTPLSSSSSPFNPAAPSFIPSSFSDALAPRLSLQTSEDESYHLPLHPTAQPPQPASPFTKPRPFGSAPASSTSSPVPSSRNILYAAQSPSHLLQQPSLASPHALHFEQQQRALRAAQKPPSSGAPSPLSSRGSPSSFPRPIQPSRPSPSGAFYSASTGGSAQEWDQSQYSGVDDVDAEDEQYAVDDEEAKAYEVEQQRDRQSLHGASGLANRFSGNLGFYSSRRDATESSEQSPLFLPALPTFPSSAPPGLAQVNLGPNPLLNLTVEAVRGNVMRLVKCHAGSRFVQQKLDARDAAFFALFYEEMADHVPELMVDNFAHFAIEKLIAACSDEQCLALLQRLAPAIAVVACQKHGSFSVQALVDSLTTPAQVHTLVEAMKPDIMRILTHASGHFVVLRMLQRFPYQSTRFIDDAIVANVGVVATDHHGLRVVKALLCVRRVAELTRLFKVIARMTMRLVEHPYGNYCVDENTALALARGGAVLAKDVRVGDQLAGQDAAVVTVQSARSLDVTELYRITTATGAYEVSGNHLITLRWIKPPHITISAAGRKSGPSCLAVSGPTVTMRASWHSADGEQRTKLWRCRLMATADVDKGVDDDDRQRSALPRESRRRSSSRQTEAHELRDITAAILNAPHADRRPSIAPCIVPLDGAAVSVHKRTAVVDAEGTREQLEAIAMRHLARLPASERKVPGQLFEVPAAKLHDVYWRRWRLGQESEQPYATGALTVLRAPVGLSAELITPAASAVEQCHLERFARAVTSAGAAAPGQPQLERFTFCALPDGSFAPLAQERTAGMVYQLHHALGGEDGIQSPQQQRTVGLHVAAPGRTGTRCWASKSGDERLVISELNPIAAHAGDVQSVHNAYDEVCSDGMQAALRLHSRSIVAFGSHGCTLWRDAVRRGALGLSNGFEERVAVNTQLGPCSVVRLCVLHTSDAQQVRKLHVYLAPHPASWSHRGLLAATLAVAHGVAVNGVRVPVSLESSASLTAGDPLVSLERVQRCGRVVDVEVDGNHRYALASGQLTHNCVQAVLDVAPPGVRTNIKVKMEGKYMRLSKQKFSSNVVEKCLKQSSAHWRTIIIRELTAQPAVAELLRDRYGNYVLQTGLNVANAAQVQDILRAITPYLPSLRDNVRSKWKKMLKKAGAAVARGGADDRDDGEPSSPDPRNAPQQPGDDDGDADDGGGSGGVGGSGAGLYGAIAGGGDLSAVYTGSQQSPHGGSPAFNYRALPSPSHGSGGLYGGGGGAVGGGGLSQSLNGGLGPSLGGFSLGTGGAFGAAVGGVGRGGGGGGSLASLGAVFHHGPMLSAHVGGSGPSGPYHTPPVHLLGGGSVGGSSGPIGPSSLLSAGDGVGGFGVAGPAYHHERREERALRMF